MNPNIRQMEQSPVYQGAGESIPYTLDTSTWPGTDRTGLSMVALLGAADVTSTVQASAPSASGTTITFEIANLVAGSRYRITINWSSGGGVFGAWGEWVGQK